MTLKPGVAYCFRAFYSMISDMVEGSWSHFVRRLNTELLGTTTHYSVAEARGMLEKLTGFADWAEEMYGQRP